MSWNLPTSVTIVEVGPRDGLQNEDRDVPTDDKVRLIDALSLTGVTRMEATSFVHPRSVPQLRDAADVLRRIKRQQGLSYSVLVPNQIGFQRALESGVEEIQVFLSASESHNRLNVNRLIAESLQGIRLVCEAAQQHDIKVRGSISTSFGCSIEGEVPPAHVIRIARELRDMGVFEVSFGDTMGLGNPRQVYDLFGRLQDDVPGVGLAAHFHDTRGTGLANALAALQAGITVFDASVGGMGGCPNTPGAAGNVATEDLVNMFEEMGVATGIDLAKLLECVVIAEEITGRKLPGQLSKAGLCKIG